MPIADWAAAQRLDTLRLEVVGASLTVTIDQPQSLNALSPAVFADLRAVFGELRERLGKTDSGADDAAAPDWSIRGVVITGSGDRAFVAGADLKSISGMDSETAHAYAHDAHELFTWIETLPVPVIAAVNGFALGGGCELALTCDMVYASENAVFGLPEVSLGIVPGFGGCVRLQRFVGPAMARELIFTARRIDAVEARRIGLASRVLPDSAALLEAARGALEEVAQRSPAAVAVAKRTIEEVRALPTDEAVDVELDAFATRFGAYDMVEGVAAFIEKRPARFRGL